MSDKEIKVYNNQFNNYEKVQKNFSNKDNQEDFLKTYWYNSWYIQYPF